MSNIRDLTIDELKDSYKEALEDFGFPPGTVIPDFSVAFAARCTRKAIRKLFIVNNLPLPEHLKDA